MTGFAHSGLAKAWPGLRGAWSWWTTSLAAWLPLRLRAAFGLARQRLLLSHHEGELRFALTAPGQDTATAMRDLGRLPWSEAEAAGDDPFGRLLHSRIEGVPRWLLLPARDGLRRKLPLPAAAADRLRDVLTFEIDRQTPFTAADVHFDARALGQRSDGQIDAELVVVPRARLDAALAALGPAIVATLAGVDIADDVGQPLGVNLLPGAQRRQRRDRMTTWNLALAAIAVVALGSGLWQVLQNRSKAADAFEVEAKQRGQQARAVAEEKRQLVDLVEGMRFLQTTRAGRPSTVEVLEELSRRLPDNTTLDKVSIEGDKLLIIGLSGEAPRLVERLQSSKLWHAMTLTGALQPDPASGKDRFTLSADLSVAKAAQTKPARAGQQGGGYARDDF